MQWLNSCIVYFSVVAVTLGAYNLFAKRASFKDDGVLQQFVTEMAGQPNASPAVIEEVGVLGGQLPW